MGLALVFKMAQRDLPAEVPVCADLVPGDYENSFYASGIINAFLAPGLAVMVFMVYRRYGNDDRDNVLI